jgi:hypothetical protein
MLYWCAILHALISALNPLHDSLDDEYGGYAFDEAFKYKVETLSHLQSSLKQSSQ